MIWKLDMYAFGQQSSEYKAFVCLTFGSLKKQYIACVTSAAWTALW